MHIRDERVGTVTCSSLTLQMYRTRDGLIATIMRCSESLAESFSYTLASWFSSYDIPRVAPSVAPSPPSPSTQAPPPGVNCLGSWGWRNASRIRNATYLRKRKHLWDTYGKPRFNLQHEPRAPSLTEASCFLPYSLISRVQLVLRDVRARLADWAPRGLSHSCITSRTDCARAALVRVHTDRPSR